MPTLFLVLFIVSLFPMVLAILGGFLRKKQFGKFDNKQPRLQQAHMTGLGARVMAAQQNAWEALIFYSVVCLLAYISGLNFASFALPAGLFLMSRIFHALFYILDMDVYRSLVFFIGWFSCLYIAIQALMAF